MNISSIPATLLVALITLTPTVRAQAPGVPIESTEASLQNPALLEKAKVLQEAGKLLNIEQVKALLQSPVPAPILLPEPGTKPLIGREIAERARKAYVRLGWYYLCPRCDHWHLNLAAAYAISADGGIATCHHVLVPGGDMREGYLIAVDHHDDVLAVTGICAKSQTMDAAIARIEGGACTPLPLNDNIAPGDPAFCLSDPLDQRGYFSQGIVNRFLWMRSAKAAEGSLDQLKNLRVNVSTDWAPGSSGAAVLDQCGNAIGHVSTISPMTEGRSRVAPPADAPKDGEKKKPAAARRDRFAGATLITLHEAVPARAILALVRAMNDAASKPKETSPAPVPAP